MAHENSAQDGVFTLERIQELIEPDAVAARDALDEDDIRLASESSFDLVFNEIEKLVNLVGLDSRIVADIFWREVEEKIADGEQVSLGHRVRVKNGTLEIAYLRNIFQQKKGSYFADHVKRSGKFRYQKRDFKFAAAWESELAFGFEDHHQINRKAFIYMSEARRNLRLARRELKAGWGDHDEG
ncbi:conjugative transfer protein MobI(A/C) [Vreelandella rituensis]|uniref:Uncharacterized protein n=1 Tax=Vreelandella rituensis TaxID=2282306 RepID=A0A368TWF5_9GAMM|nr:conjugative transfer protein MobI(A/C) [Halomonas rituensis]RCV89034.1 hypothetical protein DU506_13465 [Halomonas rituensis]